MPVSDDVGPVKGVLDMKAGTGQDAKRSIESVLMDRRAALHPGKGLNLEILFAVHGRRRLAEFVRRRPLLGQCRAIGQ
jgi:hypothetical protein